MKSKVKLDPASQDLQKLSLSIGDFIRYWGFRRVHGAIWTQLYLSKKPLSCTDLTLQLGLSKALISPALDELCQFKLIFEVPSPNEKTKLYQAEEDTNAVIRHVLKTRESKMLREISKNFSSFKKVAARSDAVNSDHLKSLEEMIFAANLMLEMIIDQKDLMKFPQGFES